MSSYDVITTRHYTFDDNGRLGAGLWEVTVSEREILIPDLTIMHIHARSAGTGTTRHYLTSIDSMCTCGKRLPSNVIDDCINKAEHRYCYTAIERGAYYRLDLLKKLADGWYLDENKKQKEPALFHICNPHHPAYLYYGKGIPISHIAIPPWPYKCKTCRLDIPKGIRLALLIISKGISLK